MDDVIKLVITVFGTQTITVVLVAYFVRLWFEKRVEQDLERFRADLQRQALEHEVRTRRVDERVAEHINGIYSRLFRFYEAAHSYVRIVEDADEPTKTEKLETVRKTSKEFYDYLLLNRLYVSPGLFKRIRSVADKLADVTSDVTRGIRREQRRGVDPDRDPWMEAIEAMRGEVDVLFAELVAVFQKRLGVVDEG